MGAHVLRGIKMASARPSGVQRELLPRKMLFRSPDKEITKTTGK